MREIKFRGKRTDNGEWVCGFFYAFLGEVSIIDVGFGFASEGSSMGFSLPEVVRVDPATVGQFTGLKDKNGKEIYEGDILRQDYAWGGEDDETGHFVGEVAHYPRLGIRLRHCLRFIDGRDRPDPVGNKRVWPKVCEVIGNVHENRDLLQKGAV